MTVLSSLAGVGVGFAEGFSVAEAFGVGVASGSVVRTGVGVAAAFETSAVKDETAADGLTVTAEFTLCAQPEKPSANIIVNMISTIFINHPFDVFTILYNIAAR